MSALAGLRPKFEFLLFNFRLANLERISQQRMRIDNFEAQLHLAFAMTA